MARHCYELTDFEWSIIDVSTQRILLSSDC
jgi:hypothetical protein